MKNNKEKCFDAVQMVRDIRDAMFEEQTNPNFNPNEFEKIIVKWEEFLEQEESHNQVLSLSR